MSLESQLFGYVMRKDGSVAISHDGRTVMVVTGADAQKLQRKLLNAPEASVQLVLAKITGNFKRGNERTAANHTRNAR